MDDLDMITLTRLPNHGWILESGSRVVVAPDDPDRVADAVRAIVAALDRPCAGGQCPDPAAHAEGGHDV
jgi:hypothetical protein